MKPVLVIASQLDGKGTTGVETHFNLILRLAIQFGAEAILIEPHTEKPFFHRLRGWIVRLLGHLSPERATLWNLCLGTKFLEQRLRQVLKRLEGRQIIIYAQDPHSTKAALAARNSPSIQVMSIVHYNVSEASEMAVKGLTSEGQPLWNKMMKTEVETLPHVDKLIFVSDFMQHAVNHRLQNIAIVPQIVIPNFPALPRAEINKDSLVSGDLIAIGTLEPRKNQSFLLYVLAECKALGKNYKLTIVGDGPDRTDLESLSTELGVAEQVNFLGFQKDAAQFIPTHRVLVHAARMESFGIVLAEAMSYKRPALAAPVGGIPEVLTDGKEGYYWDLDNPRLSAEMLISILEDSQKWQMMSEQAGNTFITRFHPDLVGKRWMKALLGV